jgi:hypothetical protein
VVGERSEAVPVVGERSDALSAERSDAAAAGACARRPHKYGRENPALPIGGQDGTIFEGE